MHHISTLEEKASQYVTKFKDRFDVIDSIAESIKRELPELLRLAVKLHPGVKEKDEGLFLTGGKSFHGYRGSRTNIKYHLRKDGVYEGSENMDAERSYGVNWNKMDYNLFVEELSYRQLKCTIDSLAGTHKED